MKFCLENFHKLLRVSAHFSVIYFVMIGDVLLAQSKEAHYNLINFEERRGVALARISSVTTNTTMALENEVRERIKALNGAYAQQFKASMENAHSIFDKKLSFINAFSEEKVRSILSESISEVDFKNFETQYYDGLNKELVIAIVEIYTVGITRMQEILFDEYISMLPPSAQKAVDKELSRLISELPEIQSLSLDSGKLEVKPEVLDTVIGVIIARRLATSLVGKRLLAGLGKRLAQNAISRGLITVIAPGGEICGPAIIICEAGLFAAAVSWEGVQYRKNVVKFVKEALDDQTSDLQKEITNESTIDEVWEVIDTEAKKLLTKYREAAEQIMVNTFDNVVKQNSDFKSDNLPREMKETDKLLVFRKMATTFGHRFLEYTWSERYAFMNATDERAWQLLAEHGPSIIDLYLQRPVELTRLIQTGISSDLLKVILLSDEPVIALSDTNLIVRRMGSITDDVNSILVDVIELDLPIQPGEIDPQGVRVAAERSVLLREMAKAYPATGRPLYAQILKGAVAVSVLDYLLAAENPILLVDLFTKIPPKIVANLIETYPLTLLEPFAIAFPTAEAINLLTSEASKTHLEIFNHRSGGPDAVLAWQAFVRKYKRPTKPWMKNEFLWILDQRFEPYSVSLAMLNAAHDGNNSPNFMKSILVQWAQITGRSWISFLIISLVIATAVLFSLKVIGRFRKKPRFGKALSERLPGDNQKTENKSNQTSS